MGCAKRVDKRRGCPHTAIGVPQGQRGNARPQRQRPLWCALSLSLSLHHCLVALVVALTLTACGAGDGRFRIEGRFRNLNRGEFYVYSPDGGTTGRDTIHVADGRFAYEVPLSGRATFILIFPNFSQQVVFGESGKTVKVRGDASHMREMKISGTKDNEQMTDFRMNANGMSPPEVKEAAVAFVKANPRSPVSVYLVNHYLVSVADPDYVKAAELLYVMLKETPGNGRLALFLKQVESLKASSIGNRLPQFSATDIDGNEVTRSNLMGKVNVVSVWSSWNYDSQNMQRWLFELKRDYGDSLAVVSVCVDARVADCRRWVEADSIDWPNICDGKMWESPLLSTFGLFTVPGNVVADAGGTIVARNLNTSKMREQVRSMFGDNPDGGKR